MEKKRTVQVLLLSLTFVLVVAWAKSFAQTTFTDVTEVAGVGDTGPEVAGDYDSDGFLDIFVAGFEQPNVLYHNNGNSNNWLHVKTIGTKSNRDGIGARVKVVAGDFSMIREISGSTGFHCFNSMMAEFGLGMNTTVDLLEIRWPSGTVDTFTNVRANQVIEVTESASEFVVVGVESLGKQLNSWGKIKRFALYQNYPNPFNPETWIPFKLAEPAIVTISIYDAFGSLVRTLELGHKKVGSYISKDKAAYWDGRDSLGQSVASGVYFYTLQARPDVIGINYAILNIRAGEFKATRKMVIMK